MNENQNLFEGIPSLGDTQGLTDFVNNQAAQSVQEPTVPTMLQPQNQGTQVTPVTQPVEQPTQTINVGGVQYTAEQVQQIIENAQKAQTQTQIQSQVQQPVQPAQTQNQPTYSAQQAVIIKQLIDRGVPLDKIQAVLNGNQVNTAVSKRIEDIEQYLQQQEYARQEQEFVNKMTTFGNKFGLSEDDLVLFANTAMQKGINVATVTDVEAVFRAIYPEQYAIRMQRMSAQPSSQLYGGTSIPESPRAMTSQMEDAYVEAFLKGAMPNQYNMKK